MVYGCDAPWWFANDGLPQFKGVKLCHDTSVCTTYADVNKVEIQDLDNMTFSRPGMVTYGGNSGYQAINLAAQFGARRILLVGFDMHGARGVHWYGQNRWKDARNPGDPEFVKWRDRLNSQGAYLAGRGIEVVNSSPDTALTGFRCADIETMLREWQL